MFSLLHSNKLVTCYHLGRLGNKALKMNTTYMKHPTTVKAPLRQHRLLTMASKKKRKPRSTPKERVKEQEIKCLKYHLVWSNQQKSPMSSEVQYSVLPRAMSDEDGNPHT